MVGRKRHQHYEINAAFTMLRKLYAAFSVVEDHHGHRWGWIICICGENPFLVNSTPLDPGTHAKQIHAWAAIHEYCGIDEKEEAAS